jgi:GPH family glycoside/pentoside/hexuronide:cation symporter
MPETQITSPLTLKRILLYSCASIGLNIMSITVSTWLLYFYAPPPDSGRTQYLSVTLVGLLLTVGRLWDAVIDPLIGYWSDVNRSRWGRRRPFLIFATPVTAIALLLLWAPPATGSGLFNALYFLLVTIAFYTSLSLISIPYDSSLPEMAAVPADYVTLSMWKNIFGTTGVLIGALVASPLFSTVGPLAMGLVVGGIGLVTVWLTLMGLREKEYSAVDRPIGVRSSLRLTFGNRQFLSMFASTLTIHVAYAMLLANLPYFVTLVVGKSEANVSIFQGVVVVTMVVFAPLWNWLSQRYPNRTLLRLTMLGLAGVCSLTFFVGLLPGISIMTHALLMLALIGPLLGGYFVLVFAMMGSVVDYDELLTSRRREAIYYGTFSLAVGVGPTLAALLLPFIFEHYGYTATNPLGVRVAFLVTGLLALLGTLAFAGYRLGDTPEETQRLLGLKS